MRTLFDSATEIFEDARARHLDLGTAGLSDYDEAAVEVATALRRVGSTFLNWEPGNGTAYDLVFTLLDATGQRRLGGDLLVALPHFRSCWALQSHGDHHTAYISEKFKVGASDAAVLATLLTLISAHLATGGDS